MEEGISVEPENWPVGGHWDHSYVAVEAKHCAQRSIAFIKYFAITFEMLQNY